MELELLGAYGDDDDDTLLGEIAKVKNSPQVKQAIKQGDSTEIAKLFFKAGARLQQQNDKAKAKSGAFSTVQRQPVQNIFAPGSLFAYNNRVQTFTEVFNSDGGFSRNLLTDTTYKYVVGTLIYIKTGNIVPGGCSVDIGFKDSSMVYYNEIDSNFWIPNINIGDTKWKPIVMRAAGNTIELTATISNIAASPPPITLQIAFLLTNQELL